MEFELTAQALPQRRGRPQAVLFDLDGTLRVNQPAGQEVFYDLLEGYGHAIDGNARRRATRWLHGYWADSDELKVDLLLSGGSMAGLYRRFADKHMAALGLSRAKRATLLPSLSERMREEYQPESVVPAGVPSMLTSLKQDGFRLGLVSNRDTGLQESSDRHGLSEHFEIVIEAGEVGRWKPQPELFWEALNRLGVAAGAAVYVGDNYFADVLGARAAGLQPILVDPQGLFPEANCPVVQDVGQVGELLHGDGWAR